MPNLYEKNRAVIFDMDGVIVDSELHWEAVENELISSFVPDWRSEFYARVSGLNVRTLYEWLQREFGLEVPWEDFRHAYDQIAEKIYRGKTALIPGARELIGALRAGGTPLALASSSPRPWIDIVLDRFDLREYFGVIVSADDLGGRGKPAPDIYLRTAELLGIHPGSCVAIEDSRHGVAAAKAAGMRCVGFRNGFNQAQDLSASDLVITDFSAFDLSSF